MAPEIYGGRLKDRQVLKGMSTDLRIELGNAKPQILVHCYGLSAGACEDQEVEVYVARALPIGLAYCL